MTTRTLLAAAITALALPAYAAADASRPSQPPETPDFNFSFSFDLGDILADAGGDKMREHAEHMREWADNFAAEMQSSMAMVFSDRVGRSKVVKGAPYSAEAVSETNQTLGDGNVITHKRTSRVYRDGDGRTRQETLRGDAVRSVYIYDPVEGMSYTLLPGSKLAVGVKRKVKEKDKVVVDDTSTSGEHRVVIRRSGKDGDKVTNEVTVQVVRVGDGDMRDLDVVVPPAPPTPPVPPRLGGGGRAPTPAVPPVPPVPPMPGIQSMMFHNLGALGKGTTTSLGTKTFEGVKAEGKQTTWTIPAGQVGNRAPIVVTSESWYSPELQVTLYTRYNDPRTGESIYRLAALKRAEPAPDLFKVPPDYKMRGKRDRAEEREERQRQRREGAKDKG